MKSNDKRWWCRVMPALMATLVLASAALVSGGAGARPAAPAAAPPSPAAAVPPARGPAYHLALEAAQLALADCAGKGYKVSVTVVDSTGAARVVLADDGARQRAVDSSAAKALTVITFRESSGAVEQHAAADPALAARIAADSRLRARAGGLPLVVNGEIIGAIGVGGAPGGEKDEACAATALAAVGPRLQ
jgi:uncharacterized protein GlcG (DUF336 family)